jgi:plastocyanin
MVDDGATVFKFEPKAVRVQRGDTLRFEQTGAAPHNVELKHIPRGANLQIATMGPFLLAKGATYDIVIDATFVNGEYKFDCTPHQMFGMKGTFTVTGG